MKRLCESVYKATYYHVDCTNAHKYNTQTQRLFMLFISILWYFKAIFYQAHVKSITRSGIILVLVILF